ncbi:hypothetical protein [Flavivirga algicola]|uniref:Uncharacterized protein n=1 Tax=Flavivirga algicola TaxID=2729136 RepID=A0ABX1S4U5_9FLAO|nr:hypothetical protein [Flavivirga algicola]NMH89883.1 hypothetical protein [Flavivirga algicola]
MNLISKDENIKNSIVYIGYVILKELSLRKEGKMSIYDIAGLLKKENLLNGEQLNYSLMFLYATDIVDFQEPYIYVK